VFRALLLLMALAAATAASASTAATSPPSPVFGKTVELRPVSGSVLVRLPRSAHFVALRSRRVVPIGTVVNSTAGQVGLTAATPSPTQTHTGQFHAGDFKIGQPRSLAGLTTLTVIDSLPHTACATATAAASKPLSTKVLGLLRGKAHGGFETVGKFSAATVRGTQWGVRNRCDGTLTVDTEGVVSVTDFRSHKTIVLHTGQTYLAKGP
jgi:hypothetical protein